MTMKMRSMLTVCLLLSVAGTLFADHWSVNPHAYQYDMTAYVQVATASGSYLQQGDYEVAAFCADECRGVGKLLTATDGTQVFQLRIRSNEASGEVINFRVYRSENNEELYPGETVTFASQSVSGTPGEPLLLLVNTVLKGDVNGDGEINAQDASLIQQFVARKFGATATGFSVDGADVNGDGEVTAQDASLVQQYAARKITW